MIEVKAGRREWHTSSGSSRRSLVENSIFRYKAMIGQRVQGRTFEGQRVEAQLAGKSLNTITRLGMPDRYRMA